DPKDTRRLKYYRYRYTEGKANSANAEDWENFESRLRSAVLFKQIRPEKGTPINESPQLFPKFK
ncbi:Hypothetical predicted protein, partial [Paramuricea clavata]